MSQSFTFTVVSTLHATCTKVDHVDFRLEVSDNLHKPAYVTEENPIMLEGSKAVTQVLVSALAANIKMAHEAGYRNDAEHLRFAIRRLEDLFVLPQSELSIGEMDK